MFTFDDSQFKLYLANLYKYLQSKLNFKTIPKVKLVNNKSNSEYILGKTGYYSPKEKLIALYITDRHPKDILRSFAHECIHMYQDENNMFDIKNSTTNHGYAQTNSNLRDAEKHAYLMGNMYFRDWEDNIKYHNYDKN